MRNSMTKFILLMALGGVPMLACSSSSNSTGTGGSGGRLTGTGGHAGGAGSGAAGSGAAGSGAAGSGAAGSGAARSGRRRGGGGGTAAGGAAAAAPVVQAARATRAARQPSTRRSSTPRRRVASPRRARRRRSRTRPARNSRPRIPRSPRRRARDGGDSSLMSSSLNSISTFGSAPVALSWCCCCSGAAHAAAGQNRRGSRPPAAEQGPRRCRRRGGRSRRARRRRRGGPRATDQGHRRASPSGRRHQRRARKGSPASRDGGRRRCRPGGDAVGASQAGAPGRSHGPTGRQLDRLPAGGLARREPAFAGSAEPVGRSAEPEPVLHPSRPAARRRRPLVGRGSRRVRRQHRQRPPGAPHWRRGLAEVAAAARPRAPGASWPPSVSSRCRSGSRSSRATASGCSWSGRPPNAPSSPASTTPARGSWAGGALPRYSLAVMNGEPIGERTFPLRDPNGGKDFIGRVGIDTPITSRVWVAGGFSGLSGKGFHAARRPQADGAVERLNGNGVLDTGEVVVIAGVSADSLAELLSLRVRRRPSPGRDVPRLGATVLYGEIYWAKNLDRGILPADPGRVRPRLPRAGPVRGRHAGPGPARHGRRAVRLLQPRRRFGESGDGRDACRRRCRTRPSRSRPRCAAFRAA